MASVEGHIEGYVTLLGVVEKEDGQFVSYSPQLGVASCGDTLDEALDNLDEALVLYLKDLEETGDLERVFQERGIEIKLGPPPPDDVTNVPVRPKQTVKVFQQQVPLAGVA